MTIPLHLHESISVYHDRDSNHEFLSDGMGFCIICTNNKYKCQFCGSDVRMAGGMSSEKGKATCWNCKKGVKEYTNPT